MKGMLPYRDFKSLYPPGNFYLLSFLYHASTPTLLAERILGLLYWLSIVGGVYWVGLRFSQGASLAAAITATLILSLLEVGAYAMLAAQGISLLALTLVIRMAATANPGIPLALAGGVASGLVMWFRQDVGAVLLLANSATCLLLIRKQVKWFIVGAAIPAMGLLALLTHIGLNHAITNLIIDPALNAPGRKLPLSATPLTALLLTACAIALISCWKSADSSLRLDARAFLLSSGLFSVGLLPSALQRPDIWHIAYISVTVISLTCIRLHILLESRSTSFFQRTVPWFITAASFFAPPLTSIKNTWGNSQKNPPHVENSGRSVYVATPQIAHCVKQLTNYITNHTTAHDRIFFGPTDLRLTNYTDVYLYHLLPHLTPASVHIEMNPGVTNAQESSLATDLINADIIALTSRYNNWHEPNASMKPGNKAPNQTIRENFCNEKTICEWVIYRKCRK